jgi:hypothetical protein
MSSYAVAIGPLGYPTALGTYDGNTTSSHGNNFTAVSFTAGDRYQTSDTAPTYTPTTSATTSAAVSGIKVEGTIQNNGNLSDTYTITAVAPTAQAGWTVSLQTDTGGNQGTAGANMSAPLGGAGTAATSIATNVTITSGATLNYWAVYNAPAGVPYLSHGIGSVTVLSNHASPTLSDVTHHLIYAGFVAVTTTAAIVSGCPSNMTPTAVAGTVCPNGTITYTVDYRNVVATSDTSTAKDASFGGVIAQPGTLIITADGTNTGNTWYANSVNGLNGAPVDSLAPNSTTFHYYTGSTAGSDVGSNFQSGISKFTATIGGSSIKLVPLGYGSTGSVGTQGTILYAVTVK